MKLLATMILGWNVFWSNWFPKTEAYIRGTNRTNFYEFFDLMIHTEELFG